MTGRCRLFRTPVSVQTAMIKPFDKFEIEWRDGNREPQCRPNPDFPEGRDVDGSLGRKSCLVKLPYPAKRCGTYVIYCNECHASIGCTTAGRPDDPRSIKVGCKQPPQLNPCNPPQI